MTQRVVEQWLSLLNLIALLAWYGGRIVGHAYILEFSRSRRRGVGDDNLSSPGFPQRGTRHRYAELLRVAKSQKMHRIGLEVVVDNECAVHLYKKVGLKVEGVLEYAYFGEDGKYHDELTMALILE